MPGRVPGIHVFTAVEDVDGRNKCGHDERKNKKGGLRAALFACRGTQRYAAREEPDFL